MDRLYEQLAHLWPLLSPLEDYAADADRIATLIHTHLKADGDTPLDIIELGAGGGHTLFYFGQKHRCTAVDLSDAMLENSRHINPDVTHVVADMRTLQLDQQFDVVLIHDAIDYLTTEADVAATLSVSADHLRPGGLLIVAPTYVTETFVDGESMEDENSDDDIEIRYVTSVSAVPGKSPLIEMNLTIFVRDLATELMTVETDRHVCGLFSKATWMKLMSEAGFEVTVDAFLSCEEEEDDGEPIPTFVGRKR